MSFTKKLYIWMLILLIAAVDIACVAVYLRSLSANKESETRRASTEQYAVQLGLSEAESEKELAALFTGFANAYASTGAEIALIRSTDHDRRVTEIVEDGDGRAIRVTGPLSDRFGELALVYRRDLQGVARTQRALLNDLLRINLILTVVFCALLIASLSGLTKPIRSLSRAMEALKLGRMPRRINTASNDEIAELSRQFASMAETIRRRTAQLEDENKRRQRFIDDLSHEMKTPATSVSGYAQLLRDAKLDAEQRDAALDFLVSESDRMQKLAGKLLTLMRLRPGELEFSTIPIEPFIEHVKQATEPLIREKGVAFETTVSCDSLYGDEALLTSLAINLIQNAARASKSGDVVKLSISKNALTVDDEGVGMTKEQIAHACDPFYRADKARSREQGGVGLGLSICAAIARAHGAKLGIKSHPNTGTVVRVEFTTLIQPVDDLLHKSAVSSTHGNKTVKEGTFMKIKQKALLSTLIAAAVTVVLCAGSIVALPKILAEAEQRVAPAVKQEQLSEQEELIPLPVPDDRYFRDRIAWNRKLSDDENKRIQNMELEYIIAYDEVKLPNRSYAKDGTTRVDYIIQNTEREGIGPIGDVPIEDGIYTRLDDDSLKVFLPDRALTDDEIKQWVRYEYTTILPKCSDYDIFNDQEGNNRSQRYTTTYNEGKRSVKLEYAYDEEGLRPQQPIPTSPTEDGFWLEQKEDGGVIHYTNTYEMTDEQLLQIIDWRRRLRKEKEDKIAKNPDWAKHTPEEWSQICKDMYKRLGAELSDGLEWSWDVHFVNYEKPQLIRAKNDKQGTEEELYDLWFIPSQDNRIVKFMAPITTEGFGMYLKAPENIS